MISLCEGLAWLAFRLAVPEAQRKAFDELLGLRGETPQELLELAGVFGRGLGSYRARDFDAAERFLSEALRLRPDDGPSKVLLGRIAGFRKSPPPQDWDGSHEMHEK